MRTTTTLLSAAALAGIVSASPAPQQLDFAQISAAPSVQAGPTGVALNQTVSLQTSVQVTTVATAAASGTSSKRDLEKRTFGLVGNTINNLNCLFLRQCGSQSSGSSSQAAKSTSCSSSSTIAKASATVAPVVISSSVAVVPIAVSASAVVSVAISSSTSAPVVAHTSAASATIQTSSGTTTTSSSTECPTQIEEGTYCGFINPEDPCSPQPGGELMKM